MPPDLHVSPDRLRGHAATAAALADELRAAVAGWGPAEFEADRLRAAVRRTAVELTGLGADLAAAATHAERSDQAAAAAFRRPDRG